MSHLLLTSLLLLALLAIVAVAIGACLGIAGDLALDGAEDDDRAADDRGDAREEFGVGLPHAATFAQSRGGPFAGGRSFGR